MRRAGSTGKLSSGSILAAGLVIAATVAALVALKVRKFEPRVSTTQPASQPATPSSPGVR